MNIRKRVFAVFKNHLLKPVIELVLKTIEEHRRAIRTRARSAVALGAVLDNLGGIFDIYHN